MANDGGAPPFLLSQKHAGAGVLARRIALRRQPHAMAGPTAASERPGETALGACEWENRGRSSRHFANTRSHAKSRANTRRPAPATRAAQRSPSAAVRRRKRREAARPPTVVPSGFARRCGGGNPTVRPVPQAPIVTPPGVSASRVRSVGSPKTGEALPHVSFAIGPASTPRNRCRSGCQAGRYKFFMTKSPLPINRQRGRTRLWAASLRRLTTCVQLVALSLGEQPGLGAR